MKKSKKNVKKKLFAVIGLGRFGMALAEQLAQKGKDVLVIDRDRVKIEAAARFTDNAFVVGELTEEHLRATGISDADVAVICIGDKVDVSILTTLTVIRLGVKRVISKAMSKEQGDVLAMLGAEVVYPEHDMALRLAGKLISPHILEYISLSDTLDLMEIKLTPRVEGKTVLELNVRRNFGLNIIAICHEQVMSADVLPTTALHAEDTVTVIGKTVDIERFEEYLNK